MVRIIPFAPCLDEQHAWCFPANMRSVPLTTMRTTRHGMDGVPAGQARSRSVSVVVRGLAVHVK
jgi:hypothetical protein